MIGETVSHYRILGKLGEGGMGVVYKAEDTRLQRTVALKFLPAEATSSPREKARFLNEARAAAALSHPNICTIHEIDEHEGRSFIAMECVEGKTLKEILEGGPLPPGETARIALQAAEGLQEAHGKGIVHRDIKPANLMLTAQGRVKIMDFGLAKSTEQTMITLPGTTVGTAAYMSPEQAQGIELDGRSDVWSLGVLLYQMLTGRTPFQGNSIPALLYAVLHETPPPLAEARPGVPAPLARIVERCMEKEREKRYGSAGEVANDLRPHVDPSARDVTATGWAVAQTAPAPAAPAPASRRKRRVLFAGGALLVIGMVFLALLLLGGGGEGGRKKLAVLPLENIGPREDEYFADGITEAIIARLAGIHGLAVISRKSAMQFKGSDLTSQEIGRELGADFVLEGTIQRERPNDPASILRVTSSLISVADAVSVWADHYDKDMTELFAVQSEIAERVARALDITLLEPERRSVQSRPTENLEAYELFLRGNDSYNRRLSERDARVAVEMYERAVEIDPAFAVAWASLARARVWLKWHFGHDDELAAARVAAEHALRLAPDGVDTRMALGDLAYYGHRDYTEALEHFQFVQRSRPSESDAIASIGWIHRRRGEWEESVRTLREAMELNPRDPTITHGLGQTLVRMRRFDEAEPVLDRAVSLWPHLVFAYVDLALIDLNRDGDTAAAAMTIRNASRRIPAAEFLGVTPLFLLRIVPDAFSGICAQLSLGGAGIDSPSDSVFCLLYKAELDGVRGEPERARARADSARTVLDRCVRSDPEAGWLRGLLGVAEARLGLRDEALRDGRAAVDLLPLDRDAMSGPYQNERLAQIAVVCDDPTIAIEQLRTLLENPSRVSAVTVRLDPLWESYRSNRAFRALLDTPPAKDAPASNR
ncbi:MAG: protein kinase [Candidatus Eisenbacteria bacterium]|nr:protein kinase [Candidatus Eisenbacteria bacterium]